MSMQRKAPRNFLSAQLGARVLDCAPAPLVGRVGTLLGQSSGDGDGAGTLSIVTPFRATILLPPRAAGVILSLFGWISRTDGLLDRSPAQFELHCSTDGASYVHHATFDASRPNHRAGDCRWHAMPPMRAETHFIRVR